MKKIALVFLLAVFVPSLVLAWLAVRSLHDQQLILERQQWLLYQGVADSLAKEADNLLIAEQHEFGQQVEALLGQRGTNDISTSFDDQLRPNWAQADVGFVVTENGVLTCPLPSSGPNAQAFCVDNSKFLGNRESAEVYWNGTKIAGNYRSNNPTVQANAQYASGNYANPETLNSSANNNSAAKQQQMRKVVPQQQVLQSALENDMQQYSKVSSSEAEFRQLVGDSDEGMIARFVENKLKVLLYHRSPRDARLIFGAQLSLPQLKERLKPVLQQLEPALSGEIVVALLDDTAKLVASSRAGFQTNWKHPFVATEVGEALPHWEMAVYLLDPAKLARSAQTLTFTLGLLIGILLLAIGIGSWLIVTDLNRQLTLARQKTDFVSNVSHELKTPLTSIRMFSELLAEGRVTEPQKQQSYLNIITAETSRLTRLINNVLDFSRMERGEKKYDFRPCDLRGLAREVLETYRPHLESSGFQILCESPDSAITIKGDRDALAQVVVNLLSNAEKYSNGQKEICLHIEHLREPLPHVEVRIMDRGPGVPRGSEEKIFEQFYRAHDSLSSGIQGSGLGLTLARQIARAHGGDMVYQPRAGGGSCFILRLPTGNSNG
ncbi:MAG: Integral rane sensor signal transduction histidine kinase [Pedosphaera sp.]|nr:Integral rane sensor signal transduction histidine kinase [Pedosphaera sp.]